ncbi:MAG: hypothetical protein EOM19_02440 [Candidatus Moranbacteria bacterium]|nr:hypothetical protein [Candidatus Moranbacteria bacterium]
MTIREQMKKDLVQAMLSHNDEVRDVLRLIEGLIRTKEIDLRLDSQSMEEEAVIKLLLSQVKQRKESVKQYLQGNREDLAQKEEKEILILQRYLPAPISDAVIEEIILDVTKNFPNAKPSDMGKIMGAVMAEAKKKGTVDGNNIREKVKHFLEKV